MKKKIAYCLVIFLMIIGVLGTSVIAFAEGSDQVAGKNEKAAEQQVGEEGMVPVSGSDVKDGTYDITVDSSSPMFKIVSAELTVEDGKMSAVMTMSAKGYLKVFMGTGEEAVEADESQYIPFKENEKGEHTYKVPVEALNQEIPCAAFSKDREKWYDRQLVFRADSLPEDAVLTDLDANKLDYEDGQYTVEVDLEGGTGKASITSPAEIAITDGEATARIVWSSSNYDYMKVNDKKYFPISGEETSVFEIPVYVFDSPVAVIADTTAMSTPHEIEYTLTFHKDTITPADNGMPMGIMIVIIVVVLIIIAVLFYIYKTRKKRVNG